MTTTLRTDGILFNDGSVQTTTAMATYAAQNTGDVGTYGLFRNITSSYFLPGATSAGTNLYWSNAFGANWYCYTGTSPSGTWLCTGYARQNATMDPVTIWKRIA